MDLSEEKEITESLAKKIRQRTPMYQDDYEQLIHDLNSLVFEVKYKAGIKNIKNS